jgi:hypothetical protein
MFTGSIAPEHLPPEFNSAGHKYDTENNAWMPTIYIAGPMRGYSELNHPLFFKVEKYLRYGGWNVLNPARMDIETDGKPTSEEEWENEWSQRRKVVKRDLDAVQASEAICMLPNWQESEGATTEYMTAKWAKLDLYQWDEVACCMTPLEIYEIEHAPETDQPDRSGLMDKAEYSAFVKDLFQGMQELIQQKNSDYANGTDPFANFRISEQVGVDALRGLFIRMEDKNQRIRAWFNRGDLKVKGEGIDDAFKDLIGYSCLALGLLHEAKTNK